jgi:hypothetical protein
LKLLGTVVGPREVRASFLDGKIDGVKEKLDKLVDLPNQHALLLLRMAVQQDLRHLQRILKSDDLSDRWRRLDDILWDAARRIRGASTPLGGEADSTLLSLPVRMGGLGLLSHQQCAPHAYAASLELADSALGPALSLEDGPAEPKSQRERCQQAFTDTWTKLLEELDEHRRQSVVEASSVLGRKWLNIIPFNPSLRLTNFEVSAGLHLRTLCSGTWVACRSCGEANSFGHDEVCARRAPWFVVRHERVKRLIGRALASIPDCRVNIEPPIGSTRRRNDIEVLGTNASGIGHHQYDITVVSLATREAKATRPPTQLAPDITMADTSAATSMRFLGTIAREKRQNLPANTVLPFTPLVFTIGGLMEKATEKTVRGWKTSLPRGTFQALLGKLSLSLLRSRVRNFDL